MENYIMRNGTKFELTEDQSKIVAKIAEDLGYIAPEDHAETKPKKDDPFERKPNAVYYYIDINGEVEDDWDIGGHCIGESTFDVGNYCRDESRMKQRALHETLDRLLWRYSEQHGGDPEWDGANNHWYIWFNYGDGEFATSFTYTAKYSQPYFCSSEVAEAAIKEVVDPFCKAHPEFVW